MNTTCFLKSYFETSYVEAEPNYRILETRMIIKIDKDENSSNNLISKRPAIKRSISSMSQFQNSKNSNNPNLPQSLGLHQNLPADPNPARKLRRSMTSQYLQSQYTAGKSSANSPTVDNNPSSSFSIFAKSLNRAESMVSNNIHFGNTNNVRDVSTKLLDKTFGANIRSPMIATKLQLQVSQYLQTSHLLENAVALSSPRYGAIDPNTENDDDDDDEDEVSIIEFGMNHHIIPSEANSIYEEDTNMMNRHYYDDFTSIDWVYDARKVSWLTNYLYHLPGIKGRLNQNWYVQRDWLTIFAVSIIFAFIAYAINWSELLLVDLRRGFCKERWVSTEQSCKDNTFTWVNWSDLFEGKHQSSIELSIYVLSSLFLALISCFITLTTKNENPVNHSKIFFSAAGSGVPEVKTILSGFIIRKFLGIYTLIAKTIGLIFAIASGLTIGKEGPFVHLSACVGNLGCRLFNINNELIKRQIIAAATACGFSLAFGSPLGGVLFSLEEIIYYLTDTQLFKNFAAAMIGVLIMKLLDPYGTGQPVLFETNYESEWRYYEIFLFIIIGVVGGLHGAYFVKFVSDYWPKLLRKLSFINGKYYNQILLISLLTSFLTFFNLFTRKPVTELLYDLASSCTSRNNPLLCPSQENNYLEIIYNLSIAFLVKLVLTAITYGVKAPLGIYVPSMVLGAIFGRAFALFIQYQFLHKINLDFGIYAIIGAGSFMAGITRMNVTLAITLFELTESYTYILPILISIAVANWVASSIEPKSLYEKLIIKHDFPFIKNTKLMGFGKFDTISHLDKYINKENKIIVQDYDNSGYCDCSTMSEIRQQLIALQNKGMADACIPVTDKEGNLLGILPGPEVEFALDKLREFAIEYAIRNEIKVKIVPGAKADEDAQSIEEEPLNKKFLTKQIADTLTDFLKYLDVAPIQVDISGNISLIEMIFKRVGCRSICILDKGDYVGVLHKKQFIVFSRDFKYY